MGGSAITLIDPRTSKAYAAAPDASVVVSSARAEWRSPLVVEVHRMEPFEYEEHQLVAHRLIVNLGDPVRFGWRRGGRTHEARLERDAFCLQSDGDTNAPFWRDPMTFAAMAIPVDAVGAVLGEASPPPTITFVERRAVAEPTAAQYVRALVSQRSAPGEPTYAEALGNAFVLHLLGAHGQSRRGIGIAPRGKLGARQLSAAIELAHAEMGNAVTIDALARAAGYSPFQFSRLFRNSTGLAPHQFVLRLRLERASRLIRARVMSLSEVALAVGFYDQAHLTNVFRKAFGVTPARLASG